MPFKQYGFGAPQKIRFAAEKVHLRPFNVNLQQIARSAAETGLPVFFKFDAGDFDTLPGVVLRDPCSLWNRRGDDVGNVYEKIGMACLTFYSYEAV